MRTLKKITTIKIRSEKKYFLFKAINFIKDQVSQTNNNVGYKWMNTTRQDIFLARQDVKKETAVPCKLQDKTWLFLALQNHQLQLQKRSLSLFIDKTVVNVRAVQSC